MALAQAAEGITQTVPWKGRELAWRRCLVLRFLSHRLSESATGHLCRQRELRSSQREMSQWFCERAEGDRCLVSSFWLPVPCSVQSCGELSCLGALRDPLGEGGACQSPFLNRVKKLH